jgi:hypothetical protein
MREFTAPEESRAQARTWDVVAAAFAEREPVRPTRRVPVRPLLALVVVGALTGVAFTSPGHAVLTSVRKAVGIEHARRALYSLPTQGRLLVGPWVVDADGSTRRLGAYDETSWSPFGRFVVATRGDTLYALASDGTVRWTLGRPVVRLPRWSGTRVDTRIAYFSGQRLRVVAGNGTGDREVGPAMGGGSVPPAWRPGGAPFTLAYADVRGRVWVFEPDTGKLLFRTHAGPMPLKLAWSPDGSRLLVLRAHAADLYDTRGRRTARAAGRFVDAAFVGRRLALLSPHAVTLDGRTLFRTTGTLRQVVPSPDGRWLLLTWPQADQWLFVRTSGRPRVTADANIAEQLGGAFSVAGWTS